MMVLSTNSASILFSSDSHNITYAHLGRESNSIHSVMVSVGFSLVPRPFEEEEKGPGTHCVRMRYFPSKSWEFVFLSAYLSVNVNLDLGYMPKNPFCWQRFGLKTPTVTNLAITSGKYRQKNNKEAMKRTSTHV